MNLKKMQIKKGGYAGGVQAVKFTNDGKYILSGIGPYLAVFNVYTGDCVLREHLFEGGCIKEIKIVYHCGEEYILVFGQRRINILKIHFAEDGSTVSIQHRMQFEDFNDWILDAVFLETSDQSQGNQLMAVGFARNFVSVVEFSFDQNDEQKEFIKYEIVKTVNGHPNCLLYSMAFHGDTMDNLVVASGTVFNEICVWSLTRLEKSRDSFALLRGHDGVLFRLLWSIDGRSLCSTSDDRTVRLWSFSHAYMESEEQPTFTSTIMYGHTARVWDCKLLNDFIVSSGEDKTVRVWNYQGDCVYVFRGHQSKNVWRIDIDPTQSIIASGGGDSSIKLWSLDNVRLVLQGATEKQFVLPGTDQTSKFDSNSEFTRYLKCHKQFVYAVTNSGYLYRVNNDTEEISIVFDNSTSSAGKQAFVCFDLSPCGRFCALGDTSGKCTVVDVENETKVAEVQAFTTRILNVYWIENKDQSSSLFLTSPFGDLKQLSTDTSSSPISVTEQRHFRSKNRILSVCYIQELNLLFAGDNRGSIHTFCNLHEPTAIYSPSHTLFQVHGKENVADIKFVSFDKIYSVGRDASVCCHKLQFESAMTNVELMQVRRTKLTSIAPTLLQLHISNAGKDIIVFGFYGPHFVVYDFSKSYRIASFDCGSAKGSFDVTYAPYYHYVAESSTANTYFAAYSKGGVLHTFIEPLTVSEQSKYLKETLNVNYHGKETNDVIIYTGSNNQKRVITCSEDTTIRIFDYSDNKQLTTSLILTDHENGVKALAIHEYQSNHLLFSAGGKEELICWSLTENNGLQAQRLYRTKITQTYKDIFHPDIKAKPSNIQFRVMSMTSFAISEHEFCIITGSSDGYTKIFTYDAASSTLHPVGFSAFHNGPVLCVQQVIVGSDRLLITGSTDGKIAIYSINDDLFIPSTAVSKFNPVTSLAAHQSGVNSLSVHVSQNVCTVASGGDDQSVYVAQFTWDNSLQSLTSANVPAVHTAAVNGIFTNGTHVFETSIDQRFNIWEIKREESNLELSLLNSEMTEVSDTSAMSASISADHSIDLAICGAELQIFNTSL